MLKATVVSIETSAARAGSKMRVVPGPFFVSPDPLFSVAKGLFGVAGCGLVPELAVKGVLSRVCAVS